MLAESLVTVILWQIKFYVHVSTFCAKKLNMQGKLTIEACVRARKTVLVTVVPVDIEATDAVHTFEVLEAIEGHFASTSHELKELGTLFLVEGTHSSPEPLNLLGGVGVAMVLCIALPIIYIDIWKARDQELEFLLVEDGDKLRGDNIMESCD